MKRTGQSKRLLIPAEFSFQHIVWDNITSLRTPEPRVTDSAQTTMTTDGSIDITPYGAHRERRALLINSFFVFKYVLCLNVLTTCNEWNAPDGGTYDLKRVVFTSLNLYKKATGRTKKVILIHLVYVENLCWKNTTFMSYNCTTFIYNDISFW